MKVMNCLKFIIVVKLADFPSSLLEITSPRELVQRQPKEIAHITVVQYAINLLDTHLQLQ